MILGSVIVRQIFYFFNNFYKKGFLPLQCGFNLLLFSYLFQWAKAVLEENAKFVKAP
mgnify:CR=1 FL=1